MIFGIIFITCVILLVMTGVGLVGTDKLVHMLLGREFNDDLIEEEKILRDYIMKNETWRIGTKMIIISYAWLCLLCLIPIWIIFYVCANIKYVFVKK